MSFDGAVVQILGCGYSGLRLKDHLIHDFRPRQVYETHRDSSVSQRNASFVFDLSCRDTWNNIREADYTFWLFSPEPLALVSEFLDQYRKRLGRLVVVGSTSGFRVEIPGQRVDEKSALNLEIERVKSEELIRQTSAAVVRAAGIYGPKRNPRAWLRRGLIVAGSSFLNLIHVDDLAHILLKAARAYGGSESSHFIAADGKPFRWYELSDRWVDIPLKAEFDRDAQKPESKIIDPSWTLETLGVNLLYPSVFEGVENLYE